MNKEITFNHILSISGKPGLYKMITQTRSKGVAQSLIDGKKATISMFHKPILLAEISIYTLQGEVPLINVLNQIKSKEKGGKASVNLKGNKEDLEAYFFEILPDFDEDKVYPSDIKKIVRWYNILQENKLLDLVHSIEEDNKEEE